MAFLFTPLRGDLRVRSPRPRNRPTRPRGSRARHEQGADYALSQGLIDLAAVAELIADDMPAPRVGRLSRFSSKAVSYSDSPAASRASCG